MHERKQRYEEMGNKMDTMYPKIKNERPIPSSEAADSHASTSKHDDATSSTTETELSINKKILKKPTISSPNMNAPKKRIVKKANAENAKKSNEKKHEQPPKAKNFIKKRPKKQNATSSTNVAPISQSVEPTTVRSKGPIIRVTADGSTNVINVPNAKDVAESKAKLQKGLGRQTIDGRSNVLGLQKSTLSIKYDTSTTDETWMCVSCKMKPHRFGLGDLFGPYIVTTTCEDYQTEPNDVLKRNRADMVQEQDQPQTSSAGPSGATKQMQKTKDGQAPPPPLDIFFGMTKASSDSFEVWIHGDCAFWSMGVYIVGNRLFGLEAAVWNSVHHKCTICGNNGAIICCQKRGCALEVHLPCARNNGWQLCEEEFKSSCDLHHVHAPTTTPKPHTVSVPVASTSSALE